MNNFKNILLAGFAVFGLGLGVAQADPIPGFPPGGDPDISSLDGLINYNPDTGGLFLDAYTSGYTGSLTGPNDIYWSINPTLNLSTGALTGGFDFQIGGFGDSGTTFCPGCDSGDNVFLTGTLTAFGFGGVNDSLQFLFDVTGGSLAAEFGTNGAMIWGNTGFSLGDRLDASCCAVTANVYGVPGVPVPEPSSLALLGMGLMGLGLRRKRVVSRG